MKPILISLLLLSAVTPLWAAPPDTRYFRNLPIFWKQLYSNGGETLYCGQSFGKKKGRGINVEHVFPMGWVVKALKCKNRTQCRKRARFNRIEADMHNLFPARATINKARGAMAFGHVAGESREFGRCDFEIDRKKRQVEPRPEVRGDIARAMFYMHKKYKLTIFPRQGKRLKKWHRQDPPSIEEKRRNRIIERIQGQRNLFIDQPKLGHKLQF